ncbi:MAG: hypothetical protein NC432_08970 [Roseburia sp.]|nr:hypothetical protein [Roseburia sp.]MCM1099415.1 hypothetical protein [Ruminococcus flavefaciens]
MAGTTLEKGKCLYQAGQPVTALHMITKGKVSAEYPGGCYQLSKGDVIGICELNSEVHFLGYTTLEETSVLSYPIKNMESLTSFLQEHPDVARLFLLSLFRQISLLQKQNSLSEMNYAALHQNLLADCDSYGELCDRYGVQSRKPNIPEELAALLDREPQDTWLTTYYLGLFHIYSGTGETVKTLMQEPGVSVGILRKGLQDFRAAFTALEEKAQYRTSIAACYFAPSGDDLFERLSSLYLRLGQNNEDSAGLYDSLNRIIEQFENDPSLDSSQTAARIAKFRGSLSKISGSAEEKTEKQEGMSPAVAQELTNSLNTILEYAELEQTAADTFRQHVGEYSALEDKNAMEDKIIRLRRQLTDEFYSLYAVIFEKAVSASFLPTPVKMFLYFGYVDEDLAGSANCAKLYKLAFGMEDQSSFGVYTMFHWLQAIYRGEKSPCRNEFDEDFTDYIHKQKSSGNITAAQMTAMENDPMSKVKFEMENMFQQGNKMTCGRITTFCPLFAADNVMKDLNPAFVTTSQIKKAFHMIRSIDYSAFYRESMDYDNMETMGKETIHLEFLPDIILMPNVGTRGVMWQEIEGKKRNTHGRMFLSIFHMEDLSSTMVRLTGEFRWEMCKRVQGSRWNDVSERSLTSEYFDYIQFFRKNQELSGEAKERIRNGLQRAKNSFKEMFVRDYVIWVLFEGSGSPRLNKVARRILFTYCPFPAPLAATMEQNPTYTELMERQKVLASQRVHRLEMLKQKLRNGNTPIPATLEAEINYTVGKV